MHNIARIFLCFLITGLVLIKSQAQTKYPPPSSPNGHLARSAGTYLGSVEYVRALLNSPECKKLLPSKVVPSYKNVLLNEIIPAFNKKDQSEISMELYSLEDNMKAQAKSQVSKIIAAVRKDFPSESAACGAVFASLNMTSNEAKSKWLISKKQYGANL